MPTPVTNPQRFYLELRNFYGTKDLLFVNSLGGIETIRLRGQVDATTEYNRISADKISTPEYFANAILEAETETIFNDELETFTGDTGFLPKDCLDRLRDLFITRKDKKVFEIKNGRLIPVNISSKNAQWYSNRQSMYSISLQWQHAFTNEYYSPAGLIGTASACPAIENLKAIQSGRDKLTITWALETGYDHLQIDLLAAGAHTFYDLEGNTGQQEITFTNPAVDFTGANISITGRTVCNNLVEPPDLGPVTIINLHVLPNIAPTAVFDNYTLKTGFTTPQAIGNVLDNDYDANGDAIEVVAAAGATTAGGGYTIDVNGDVTYVPPSGTFTGVDSFSYTLTEIGPGALTATGGVFITVSDLGATNSNVYVKIVTRNYQKNNNVFGIVLGTGEIWLEFYSDAAATSPMDITGLGLTVNVNKTVTTNGTPVVTPSSYSANGYEMKIYTGLLLQYDQRRNIAIRITFAVAAGTGYTGI